jgi:hypothetical protein
MFAGSEVNCSERQTMEHVDAMQSLVQSKVTPCFAVTELTIPSNGAAAHRLH